MAEQYQAKPGTGSAFKNDNKTEDWHADWRGKILLPDGTEHYLDIYDNLSKSGVSYRSVRIGNPVANANSGQRPVQNQAPARAPVAESIDDRDWETPLLLRLS